MRNSSLDVLVLAVTDNANTGWRTVQCLRRLGLTVVGLKGDVHPFLYPEQMVYSHEIASGEYERLKPLAEQAKVIHIIGSLPVETGVDRPTIVQHGGSIYRENAGQFNDYWNKVAVKTVAQCPDLMGLGAKNEVWIPYAVDTGFIKPKYNNDVVLRVGHLPSNRSVKGSEDIEAVFRNIGSQLPCGGIVEFLGVDGSVHHWQDHLNLLSHLDIYVEGLMPELNGKQYGTWGNAALEAASMAKIVVTHNMYEAMYKQEFGDHEMFIANTKEELFNNLVSVIKMPFEERQSKMRATRSWVVNKHSIDATARRWWDKVYRELFPEKIPEVKIAMKHLAPEGKRAICQVIREINEKGSSEVKVLAEEAMGMAKKMNDKLFDYRSDWDKGFSA